MYFFHPRKPRKYIDRISLYILNTNKEEAESFFQKIFHQNYMIVSYRKEILYCNDFNTSFSTFISTLVLVSMFLLLLYFLADLSGEVQAQYKWQIKNEIIARCLRSFNRQTLLPDNFFGIKNVDYFLFQSHKFLFFRKNIKERHPQFKFLLFIKILKWRFLPLIKN